MDGAEKSKAIDVRNWMPPKFIAAILNRATSTVIRMVDDGRLEGAITGGETRRTILVNPQSAERLKEKGEVKQ